MQKTSEIQHFRGFFIPKIFDRSCVVSLPTFQTCKNVVPLDILPQVEYNQEVVRLN